MNKLKDTRVMLCNTLREIAIEKSITQCELSQKTGLTQCNISRILSGKYSPTIDSILKICSALNVTILIKK